MGLKMMLVTTWTPRVGKIIARNLSKQPKRLSFYIILGVRYWGLYISKEVVMAFMA